MSGLLIHDILSCPFMTSQVLQLIYHNIFDNHCKWSSNCQTGQTATHIAFCKLDTYISNTVFSCSSFALLSSISESLFCPSSTRSCLAMSSTSYRKQIQNYLKINNFLVIKHQSKKIKTYLPATVLVFSVLVFQIYIHHIFQRDQKIFRRKNID